MNSEYEGWTKEELIAEIGRIKKFKTLLVTAIIHHYRNPYGESDKDSGERFSALPDKQ